MAAVHYMDALQRHLATVHIVEFHVIDICLDIAQHNGIAAREGDVALGNHTFQREVIRL